MDDVNSQLADQAYKQDRKRQVGSYLFDEELSDPETAIYNDPTTGKTILAARGTEVNQGFRTAARDLLADVGIATGSNIGGYCSRFKRTQDTFEKARDRYGQDISATGHSLGGALSASLAAKNNIAATTFNRGAGLPRISDLRCSRFSPFKRPDYCDKIENHRVQGDGVSVFGRLFGSGRWNKRIKGSGGLLSRHRISNFSS